MGLSTRVSVGCIQGCSKHWMWKPPTWKRAVGNYGLMDTGPESRLKVAGSLLCRASTKWEACPAKSSAIPFATRGKYKNNAWGRCKLTVVRMHSNGWCMSNLRKRLANWKYLMTGRISPWMTTLGVRPLLASSCLTNTETSSTRNRQAMISASILSEHCGSATARHAMTRDWPPSMAYTTYPAPPNVSSRRQLPSNWPTICMEGPKCISSEGNARIISFGPMDRSAMTVHRGLGEAVQTGVILALGWKPADRALVGAMRLSHGCPSGRAAMGWLGAMTVVAVQTRSGSAAECKVTASLLVACMWHGWFRLSALACWGRMSDRGSGRKRVWMACKELSWRRFSHSGTLRGTEDVEWHRAAMEPVEVLLLAQQ